MTTRDIKIKVTGVQSVAGADDEPEVLELETRGTYSEKNGNRYIKYDEFIEDVEEPVKNLLRFDEHALQLTKRGSVNTVMLFDREKNSSVHYVTPVGPICMNIIWSSPRRGFGLIFVTVLILTMIILRIAV